MNNNIVQQYKCTRLNRRKIVISRNRRIILSSIERTVNLLLHIQCIPLYRDEKNNNHN
jgi:hypothetical protein